MRQHETLVRNVTQIQTFVVEAAPGSGDLPWAASQINDNAGQGHGPPTSRKCLRKSHSPGNLPCSRKSQKTSGHTARLCKPQEQLPDKIAFGIIIFL